MEYQTEKAVVFTLSLFCLLNVGFQNDTETISTCDMSAFRNTKTFDALRKVESNGNICKINDDKLGPYQISEQYYNDSGIGDFGKGWQYVWGKGSQSYSEMIIRSYVCKHRRRNNDLTPVSVALLHKFGTIRQSSNESRNFRTQIENLIDEDVILPNDSSSNMCEPECNIGQCCEEGKCMCLNTTSLEVKECKIIQGPSSIIYIPGVIPLPIELICKVSGQPAWQVNDTEYSLEILERGNLEGHNRNKTNILVNTPVNNTKYVCVSKTADGDIFFSQPAFLFIGAIPNQVPNVMVITDSIKINANNVSFMLSWEEPFNNFCPLLNYTVSCLSYDTCPPTFTTIDNITRSYTITNLTPMGNYIFGVIATNSIGSGKAGILSIIAPSLPDQVKGVTVTCKVNNLLNQCTMDWDAITVGNGPLEQPLVYKVYYNRTRQNVTSSTTTLTFTTPPLLDGVFVDNITVIVTAINRFGRGVSSDPDYFGIMSSSVIDATAVLDTPNENRTLHSITVTCTIHPDSFADMCEVRATIIGQTLTDDAPITNGMAVVTVDGLMCEVTYTITAGGSLNGTLVGPRSFHGTITAGSCPLPKPTPTAATASMTTLPNITAQPVPIALKAGDLNVVAMSCSAVGIGLIYYHWEKYNSSNKSWISPSHRAVNIVSPDLKFSGIREEDEGVYRCIVTNDGGSVISHNATVHVYGPPIIKFITNHTISPEGDKVNLICSAVNDVNAIHPLQISWYKGNKLVTPNGKHIILYSETNNAFRQLNSTLMFDPVNRIDDGLYTCQAFNRNDSFSESKTTLTVQYPPFVSILNESPYMTNVGSLAILYCRAIGKPIPQVQWYKDDTTVNPISSSFQQTFIIPTNMPHTTVYTCRGINYIGNMKHTRSANITVIVKVIKPCLPLLDAPVNGQKTNIALDGIAKHILFSCNPNYVLKGDHLATCNNGVWSSSTPTCNKL